MTRHTDTRTQQYQTDLAGASPLFAVLFSCPSAAFSFSVSCSVAAWVGSVPSSFGLASAGSAAFEVSCEKTLILILPFAISLDQNLCAHIFSRSGCILLCVSSCCSVLCLRSRTSCFYFKISCGLIGLILVIFWISLDNKTRSDLGHH